MTRSSRPATVSRHQFQHLQSARPRDLPRAKGRAEPKVKHRMNVGESRYAELLNQRIRDGHVVQWWFEFVTLRLADDTHYRPDFLIMLHDGTLELHEVKGRKGASFYATEDGWMKVKIIAEQSPFPVRVVWPGPDGHWKERVL